MLRPCRELFFRSPAIVPRARQLGLSLALIAAISLGYEVVEWFTAIVAEPAAGTAFLGTQGDVWDAQKDSLCACVGALVGIAVESRGESAPARRPG
jgi:putative membrane protein